MRDARNAGRPVPDRHPAPDATMPFPLLYEINTRCWLGRLSTEECRGVTLDSVPESEFERWRQFGFTHIWLMGVWTTGPRNRDSAMAWEDLHGEFRKAMPDLRREDITGSPYAIANYRVPDTLGGETGLQSFRQRLHERGMKLILDFVPNHVGLDHRWVAERPDLFVQSPVEAPGTFAQRTPEGVRWLAHGKDPHFPPWSDTAQLDYRQPATRAAMRENLLGVAGRCDGLRCDMAMLVLNEVFAKTWAPFPPAASREAAPAAGPDVGQPPVEFWQEAIASTKKRYPDCLFLAEVYWGLEERLRLLGFDYTYDKELYDALVRRNPAGVQRHLLEATPESIGTGAHFLENHDEPRIASILSPAEQRAAALTILSLPGMRFLHDGQLEGARVKVPVQLRRCPPEPVRNEVERMYRRVLAALRQTAVGRGEALLLKPRVAWAGNPTSENFVIVQWRDTTPEFDLAVVNLAPHPSQCYAPVRLDDLADRTWILKDRLGSETHTCPGRELQDRGLYLDLPANGTQLFHFHPLS